ncbi:secreted RxLR effector protein 161-like [Pistacia vera]|uniref:secreted RxLR effector protein 161-like n=1 Tax=Pistacia vera TaxID=55513 RepID=UPI001263621E|nr:secreted RxLR effector protein 161-like [Pistacia vera]
MAESKGANMPLASHFMLSKSQCPKSDSNLLKMENVPYANVIGSVMYAMISTRPDLAFAISLLSDKDSRKSTTSYFFTLAGNCVSWNSQLQPIVALSSTEAEYVALAEVFKEALWL